MDLQLNADQLRRARKALARLDAIRPVLGKCKNCGIPVDDAIQIVDEHEQRLHSLVTEFAPQGSLADTVKQREQEKFNRKNGG